MGGELSKDLAVQPRQPSDEASDSNISGNDHKICRLPSNSQANGKDAAVAPVHKKELSLAGSKSALESEHVTQKYGVDKKSEPINSVVLYARDLIITWAEDPCHWRWLSLNEPSSNLCVEVAELVNVCWLEIHGKFNTSKLSPGTLYQVSFVIMLKDSAYGWDVPVNLRLVLPNGMKQQKRENLQVKPRMQWIEIPVGEFTPSPGKNEGQMEISMFEYDDGKWKKGLVVKAVNIRPKN